MPQETSHPLQSRFRRYQQQRHGRQQDPVPCVLCGVEVSPGLELYTEHFRSAHGQILDSERETAACDPAVAVTAITRKYYRRSQNPQDAGQKPDKAPSPQPHTSSRGGSAATTPAKTGADPPPTIAPPISSPSPTGASTRAVIGRATSPPSSQGKTPSSRARRSASAPDAADFPPRPHNQNATLWTGNTKRGHKPSVRLLQQQQPQQPQPQPQPHHGQSSGSKRHDETESHVNVMLRQPDTRPISQQQLVAEVKGIYKGLVLVESKCIEVDSAQTAQEGNPAPGLNPEQWQALSSLHRVLLHEHHDFFLASQHPSASPPLQRLALKYNMPARMWRHGIHAYLELLRYRLPESRQHMLSYIYLAYNMMALLYETVPSYQETWIECLGDLGRYRMAIEEEDIHDRETWTEVSRQWYKKASDLSPGTGRLYHHLAILARPNWLQQLFYYSKSLCVPTPFESARESVLTLFEPLIKEPGPCAYETQQQPIDPPLVRCHACMFMRTDARRQRAFADKFIGLLDNHIARTAGLFLQRAYTIGIANCCAMVEYGSKSNVILQVILGAAPADKADIDAEEAEGAGEKLQEEGDTTTVDVSRPPTPTPTPTEEFLQARALTCDTARLVFNRLGDPNVWPFIHVTMVFIYHLTLFQANGGMAYVERAFPWTSFVNLLNIFNTLRTSPAGASQPSKYESETFPGLAEGAGPPLPEDFAMRGLLWAERYHPATWIEEAKVDDVDKYFEVASMAEQRKDRILWLGCRIASHGRWIRYDADDNTFSVAPEFAEEEAEGRELADVGGGGMDVDSEGSNATLEA